MDPLTRLQLDIQGTLLSEAFFAVVPVLAQAKGVKSEDIEVRLGKKGYVENAEGKFGVCVVVMMPLADSPTPEVSGPRLDIIIPMAVYERPLINREASGTGETAEEISLQILAALHGKIVADGVSQLYTDDRAIDPLPIEDESVVGYMVYVRCRFGLAPRPKVHTPIISGNASAVSLFCNTAGAAIYYTTDDSFPWEGNGEATLYGYALQTEGGIIITTEEGDPLTVANPFAIAPGTTLRAAAYKPVTHLGSDVAMTSL